MKIVEIPLSESFRITAFIGKEDYSLSKGGYVLWCRGTAIETNIKGNFRNHKLYRLEKLTDDIVSDFYEEALLDVPEKPLEAFKAVLTDNDIIVPEPNIIKGNLSYLTHATIWVIAPNTSKKLVGKPFPIEFNVGTLDFGYGSGTIQELDVYITPITKKSKSVTYSMYIPKFLYNKCMTNLVIEERPKTKYIQADTLSILHSKIESLVNMAHNIQKMEAEALNAKKVLCINFNSSEQRVRDGFNHAYTGKKISTNFNFYAAFKTDKGKLFTFLKLQTGIGTTEKGVGGIIDSSLIGKRNWIEMSTPQVVIDWTQEREDFLFSLENEFIKLSEKLNFFLKDLNEEKLQKLIDAPNIKLLGQ